MGSKTDLIYGLWINFPASLLAASSSVGYCPTLSTSETKDGAQRKNGIFISIGQQRFLVSSLAHVSLHIPAALMLNVT